MKKILLILNGPAYGADETATAGRSPAAARASTPAVSPRTTSSTTRRAPPWKSSPPGPSRATTS